MRVLVDFHHSSLLRSLVMLFEERLGMEVYRPIGMEWYEQGHWAINNQRDTAEQFLSPGSHPIDGTAHLNDSSRGSDGTFKCFDPGLKTLHNACSLEYFQNNHFDYVIASIPQHVDKYRALVDKYQPKAKLIVQVGNNWNLDLFPGLPVMASVAPQPAPTNVHFYRQEFDTGVFHSSPTPNNRQISSFVNVIENMPQAWTDFRLLELATRGHGHKWKSYGGQCRDGNMTGPEQLAEKMRESQMIFHVKPGGDGYGHIIHNAYAVGRPIITRTSHYRGHLAEDLMVPGTLIDLDKSNLGEAKNIINRLAYMPDKLVEMGEAAAQRFRNVVDFDLEAKEVSKWLQNLK